MYKNNHQRLDILGAGPAGLGVGFFAKKKKIPVSIYELSDRVGGNSKTITKGDFRYDTGAHRLHDKHLTVTSLIKELLGEDLMKINAPSKIYHKGRLIDFPLNIFNLIQNLQTQDVLKIGYENFFNSFKKNVDIKSFKDLAYQNYGPTLSELFLINYTEKLWGENSNKLDPSISGKRLKNLDFISVIKSLFFGINNTKHLDGSFFYPKYGFGTIFDELANTIGNDNIFLDSKVEKIIHDGKRINRIVCAGQKPFSPGMVVNTLPLNALSKMFDPRPPDEITKCIEDIKFRDVRLCILYLNKSKFSNNASIYFPESKFPYNRIYEPKNRSKYMAPKDKTCIVIECSSSRKKTGNLESEEVFFKKIKDSLINECLIKNEDIISYKIGFIPNAYPVIDIGIQEKIGPALSYFNSFENHILHGRNAEFKYLHTHDLLKKSENLLGKLID